MPHIHEKPPCRCSCTPPALYCIIDSSLSQLVIIVKSDCGLRGNFSIGVHHEATTNAPALGL